MTILNQRKGDNDYTKDFRTNLRESYVDELGLELLALRPLVRRPTDYALGPGSNEIYEVVLGNKEHVKEREPVFRLH